MYYLKFGCTFSIEAAIDLVELRILNKVTSPVVSLSITKVFKHGSCSDQVFYSDSHLKYVRFIRSMIVQRRGSIQQ